MKKMKKFVMLIATSLISIFAFSQAPDYSWTFDCGSQGWGDFSHPDSFNTTYKLGNKKINSGHLEMRTKTGKVSGWLFGPLSEAINTDNYKYLHFSLSIENAGTIPAGGINALLVWDTSNDGIINDLKSKVFKIYSGKRNYTIDLSTDANWKGMVNINRFHLPQGDYTASGYTPTTALYRMDWITLSTSPTPTIPVQDNTVACLPIAPLFSTVVEPVVFANRFSVKTSYAGSRVDAVMKIWPVSTTDTIVQSRSIYLPGKMYFNTCDLKLNTTYNYFVEISNAAGYDKTAIRQFTTENELAENQPMNYWMTPSPFILTENANDHLLDNDTWTEAGQMVDVYKIHGATFRSDIATEFYGYDFSKLIYTTNKNRMRLAFEDVNGGNRTGQDYANTIIGRIEDIAAYGGKLEFMTWDGMMFRSFYRTVGTTIGAFRTVDEGLEAVAEATKLVKAKYPNFEIIPLPNLPNWNVLDKNGVIVPYNAADWAGMTGVPSWNYLFDIYLNKIAQKGVSINYIEIDHPYDYYTRGRTTSVKRIKAMEDLCTNKNLKLIHIINQSSVGTGTPESQDALFKQGCIDYVDALKLDGINPKYIDVESWYKFPQYLVPETKDNSFTNVVRDLGRKLTLGVQTVSSEQINVFPNPANRFVSLKIPNDLRNASIKMYDITGKICFVHTNLESGNHNFSIENLSNGMYFLQITSDKGITVRKILVAK